MATKDSLGILPKPRGSGGAKASGPSAAGGTARAPRTNTRTTLPSAKPSSRTPRSPAKVAEAKPVSTSRGSSKATAQSKVAAKQAPATATRVTYKAPKKPTSMKVARTTSQRPRQNAPAKRTAASQSTAPSKATVGRVQGIRNKIAGMDPSSKSAFKALGYTSAAIAPVGALGVGYAASRNAAASPPKGKRDGEMRVIQGRKARWSASEGRWVASP